MILAARNKPKFAIETFCFDKQIDFIRDNAQFKTAVCSRRSGKTIACAADLLDTALKNKSVVCLYITLKRTNAKRIIWPELIKLNREYSLGGRVNESDLSIKFPNDSIIYCSGAKDRSEIENFRGLALKKVYIDEAQSFRPHIEELIDDVISKALFDHAGSLCLTGTPGMVPAGYFYKCATSTAWSHHAWTMFQNPFLEKKSGKPVLTLVQDDCTRMGVDLSHPKIQRECYGRWVVDQDSLVFKYDAAKNHYDVVDYRRDWEFVIGVDLGFDDADAIAVVGWHKNEKIAYLIREEVKNKQGITELSAQLEALIKEFDPLKVVMDTGGLGKKIAEEMRRRYTLPIVAAEKSRKFEFIELLNDAMRTGGFFAKKDSRFAQDSMLLEWDLDKTTPDKKKVADGYHSDICFIGGTLIETTRGQIAIENIVCGDLVRTRQGFKPVVASGMTAKDASIMRLKFTNGSTIVCTPNHPIFTNEFGFIPADALLYEHTFDISPAWQSEQNWKQKLLNSMVRVSRDIQIHVGHLTETITVGISVMEKVLAKRPCFIGPHGSTTTAKSQMDITFTIKTAIRSITTFSIWNAFQRNSTMPSIQNIKELGVVLENAKSILKKSESLLLNGTDLKRAESGTKITQNLGVKKTERSYLQLAQNAALSISAMQWHMGKLLYVPIDAAQKFAESLVSIIKGAYAQIVAPVFQSINTVNSYAAAPRVLSKEDAGTASVYNLTVADCHEYYANGILVHNCDAVLYGFREALHWLSEAAPVKIIPMTNEWYAKQTKEMEDAALRELERHKSDDMWGDLGFE
jgi:hypothetical protein